MYAHLCKGLTRCNARMFNEILRPYAGIIRIRSMGMISASVARAPLQIFLQRYTDFFISLCFED